MPHSAPPPAAANRRAWLGLGVVLLATFMGQVDMFIVNVAVPSIQTQLHASFGQAQLVIDAYIIVYAAGLITGGRLGDLTGSKPVFQVGLAAFTVTSLLCALAPGIRALIAARALQGAAAAVMAPQVLAIIRTTFAGPDRARAISAWGTAIGAGVIAGLIGGGVLLHLDWAGYGWRLVFLVNVPVGTAALLASQATVAQSHPSSRAHLDLLGAILSTLTLACLLIPLTLGSDLHWPPWAWASLTAAVLLGTGFYRHERQLAHRGGHPLCPHSLIAQPSFPTSMAVVMAFFSGNAGLFLVTSYYLQTGLQVEPLVTGLAFTPLGIGFAVAANAVRRVLATRTMHVLVGAALLIAASLLAVPLITRATIDAQVPLLATVMGISGIGQGAIAARLINTVLARFPADDAGAGGGVFNAVTQIGMAIGVASVGALYRFRLDAASLQHGPGDTLAPSQAAFTAATSLLTALALITAALSWRLCRHATGPDW